jgi:RNA polymerase sigma factor for flagellar operon FliA
MQAMPEDLEMVLQFHATRDPALRSKLILRYVPLVHYVLGRLGIFSSTTPDYEDAVSQGLLGLIDAVDRFEPTHGAQFSTYATLRIRGSVLDHLRSMDWLSRTARRKTRAVQDAANQLWQQLGREPSEDELAASVGIDAAALQQALTDASLTFVSLDQDSDTGDGEEASLHETLNDENQPDPASLFDNREMEERLVQAIKSLSEREQLVLSLYYYDELTLREIGEVLQVSESRACQLHARAMMNLRAQLVQPEPDEEPLPVNLASKVTIYE